MIPSEEMKKFKIIVGQFHNEMKSNSVTDLVVWLDCRIETENFEMNQMSELKNRAKRPRFEG